MCGLSWGTYTNLATGRHSPGLETYCRICQAMGVPVGSFLSLEREDDGSPYP